ncbi:MAG: ion transporter [Prevotella sp.]|nr:ion transporter [Prevotella sp.]
MELVKRFFTNDNTMLVLVLINTGIIFISGFMPGQGGWLLIVDTLFTLLFLVEAVVKIRVRGFSDYWSDGWNRFDFILVLLALPSCINLFGIIFPGTSILLSLRTMRAFKTFRLLKFVPNVDNLINGIKLASKASFIVAIGLMVLLLVFSIVTTFLFGSAAPQYFGNPALSVYSIFRLFTIEGWYDMPEAIAANSGTGMAVLARIYFSFLLFLGGIIGMSLVNSIFVDAMAADNNDEVLEKLSQIEEKLDKMQQERTIVEKAQFLHSGTDPVCN